MFRPQDAGDSGLTQRDVPATANPFLDRVLENARTRPDAVFCHFVSGGEETPILWSGLMRRARAFAAAFARHDRGRGGTILLFLRHTPDMHPAFLGAMLAGCTPSFMPCTSARQDPNLYWKSHQTLVTRIAPTCIVAAPAEQAEMREAGLELGDAVLLDPAQVGDDEGFEAPPPGFDATALLQHSSGTTGLKKGVKLSYRAIHAQITRYVDTLAMDEDDVIVSWLPLYHDMGLIACWMLPLWRGTAFVHLDPFEWLGRPESLFEKIEAHRGTLVWLPNFAFEHLTRLCAQTRHDLSSMRAFIDCSEPCRAATLDRFAATFAGVGVRREALQCCYAMAETVFAVTQTALGEVEPTVWIDASDVTAGAPVVEVAADTPGAWPLVSTGRPIGGAEVEIRVDGAEVGQGVIGEVTVRAEFLFDGYNHEPELTASRLSDGWYRTRDSGFLKDGRLYILGRMDDVIIVNGKNVYAHEVEAVVSRIEGIKPGRAVAIGRMDASVGSRALVVIAEGTGDPAEATAARRQVIQAVYGLIGIKPADVRIVEPDWIVKTTSGKMSRAENERKYARVFAGAAGV